MPKNYEIKARALHILQVRKKQGGGGRTTLLFLRKM